MIRSFDENGLYALTPELVEAELVPTRREVRCKLIVTKVQRNKAGKVRKICKLRRESTGQLVMIQSKYHELVQLP